MVPASRRAREEFKGDKTMSEDSIAGAGVLVAAYTDEETAKKVLDNARDAKKNGEFDYDDAAVIRKDSEGKVHIDETGDLTAAKGAGIGALVGAVIGALAGPAGAAVAAAEGAAIGAGGGAAVGALAGSKDEGIDQEALETVGGAMPVGTSALAVVTSQKLVEITQDKLPKSSAIVAEELAATIGERLEAGQNTLLALALTLEGVVATEVVSSPTELAIFGIAATRDTVAAGGAVATEEGIATGGAIATGSDS